MLKEKDRIDLARILVVIFIFLFWQGFSAFFPKTKSVISSPAELFSVLFTEIHHKELWDDFFYSFKNLLIGYLIGNFLAMILGVFFWIKKEVALIFNPLIFFLSSIPVFALAPITIIWFGTDSKAKIIIVFFHVFFVSLYTSYKASQSIHEKYLELFVVWQSSKFTVIKYLLFPSIKLWIFSSLELTANFALLGEFVAEFISSEKGLGHYILKYTGVYDVPRVFIGTLFFSFISMLIVITLSLIKKYALRKRIFSKEVLKT